MKALFLKFFDRIVDVLSDPVRIIFWSIIVFYALSCMGWLFLRMSVVLLDGGSWFAFGFLILFGLVLFPVLMLFFSILFFFAFRKKFRFAFLLCFVSIVLILFPYDSFIIRHYYDCHEGQFENAVDYVLQNKQDDGGSYEVELPLKERKMLPTDTLQVIAQQGELQIFFCTYLGLGDYVSGFLYHTGEEAFGYLREEGGGSILVLDERWSYISSFRVEVLEEAEEIG